MNNDLLPCPFCGGEAQLFQRYPRLWNVQCEKCSVVMDPCQRSVEACKEEWNTRAESSTLSTLSARVEEERAAVVAWLREYGNHGIAGEASCLRCQIAASIERGDHLP